MRPALLRPPVRLHGARSAFSGRSFVISSEVRIVMKRRDGVVGLRIFIGI
jgi:hypothetical protein